MMQLSILSAAHLRERASKREREREREKEREKAYRDLIMLVYHADKMQLAHIISSIYP
jgi:hypothetical protein